MVTLELVDAAIADVWAQGRTVDHLLDLRLALS